MLQSQRRHARFALLVAAAAILSACSRDEEGAAAPAGEEQTADAKGGSEPAAIELETSATRPQSIAAAQILGRGLIDDGRVEAQVVEATRSGGVLTIRTRFVRQPAAEEGIKTIYSSNPNEIAYLVAGDKKYFLLTDTEGKALAPPDLTLDIEEDTPLAATWWGKFPAPPPEVTAVSLVLPNVEPIDAIPLRDR